MVSGKRKASAASSDIRMQARLGGCQAGAALRGGELVGRHIVLLGSNEHLINGQVVDWAARKVLATDGLVLTSVLHLRRSSMHTSQSAARASVRQ